PRRRHALHAAGRRLPRRAAYQERTLSARFSVGAFGAAEVSMLLGGSVFAGAESSSAMPFLKALMPPATSPIRSEILPRPNSSITTTMTISQCQMLNEPIGQILSRDGF